MNNEIKLILEGVKKGDQIGGPYELSKILAKSLEANDGFNKDDLTKRYLEWWKEDAFDTGPTYASVFTNTKRLFIKLIKTLMKIQQNVVQLIDVCL